MDIAPNDRLAAEMHFAKARENLRALGALLQPAGADAASSVVATAITTASRALDGAAAALGPDGAGSARVPCPFCGNRVVRGATLCGGCWRKLAPQGS